MEQTSTFLKERLADFQILENWTTSDLYALKFYIDEILNKKREEYLEKFGNGQLD